MNKVGAGPARRRRAAVPARLTGQLPSLAHASINESLPRARPRGKPGNLTWTVESDRIEIGY